MTGDLSLAVPGPDGTLPRQTCRGHLEQGELLTVGTMPDGEVRPYWTETRPDTPGRFHYCPPCAARLRNAELVATVRHRLDTDPAYRAEVAALMVAQVTP